MNNNNLSFAILDIVKTKQEALQFIALLDAINNSIFSYKKDSFTLFEKYLPYGKKEKFLMLAQKTHIDITDASSLQQFISDVKKSITSLPEVSMTLAFEPTQEIIAAISTWFVVNLKKAVILAIDVDTTLLGGVIIGFQGKYADFSLKKNLQEKINKREIQFSI